MWKASRKGLGSVIAVVTVFLVLGNAYCQQGTDGGTQTQTNDYNQQQSTQTPVMELLELLQGDNNQTVKSNGSSEAIVDQLYGLSSTWGEDREENSNSTHDNSATFSYNNITAPYLAVSLEDEQPYSNYNNGDYSNSHGTQQNGQNSQSSTGSYGQLAQEEKAQTIQLMEYLNEESGNQSTVTNQQQQQYQDDVPGVVDTTQPIGNQSYSESGIELEEANENVTGSEAIVLPLPPEAGQQQEQGQDQASTPAVATPIEIPANAIPIASVPAPDFFFSLPPGTSPIPSVPAPAFLQQGLAPNQSNQQQQGGQQDVLAQLGQLSTNIPSPTVSQPTDMQVQQGAVSPSPAQQQQQQQQQQVSSQPQTVSYSTAGCAGRSDNPGPGTRCGCLNIVPEGFCACAQVFFMEACENPEVSMTTDEVPLGYCDVTCGRCECCPSVYEQAKQQGLNTYVEILDTITLSSAGGVGGGRSIVDSLKNPSHTATVFIPTDEAFKTFYEEDQGMTKAEFMKTTPPLFEIAQFHVLLSLYAATAEGLLAGELGTTLATQLPTSYLTVVNQDDTVEGMIIESPGSSANIIDPDINGCHSIIHVIDKVLLPADINDGKYG